jgi:hypothetical protein
VSGTDQSLRIAAAAVVLVVGGILATLFRRDTPPGRPSAPSGGGQLVLRERMEPPMIDPRRAPIPRERPSPAGSVSGRSPRQAVGVDAAAKLDSGGLPPPLPRDYPGIDGRVDLPQAHGLAPRAAHAPSSPPTPIRTHKVVDRDTLPALAARYLGSPERADEIYLANRDVLQSPDLLPIGIELKIPEDRPEAESPSSAVRRRRMAPIRSDPSLGRTTWGESPRSE